tara:strand:- start:1128 stop:1478 length:351 start_codon:yes stop_codon:yes gene_type:complete
MDIEKLKIKLRKFSNDREWQKFHTPKNLVMALSVETAELVEIFQWLNEDASLLKNLSEEDTARVREEVADILIYIIRLSDILKIDLEQSILDKIKINEVKYPVRISKGNSTKYNRR